MNQNLNLNGLNPLAYVGVNAYTPPPFVNRAADPTTTDYQNFYIGSIWLNTATQDVWMLVSKAAGVATWVKFASSSGSVVKLTGDSGGAVFPLLGNINVIGSGVITVVGTPGTHTLTITPSGSIASSFPGDSGTAVPALGVLTVKSGTSTQNSGSTVSIVGSGSTLTLNVSSGASTLVGLRAGNASIGGGGSNTGFGVDVLSSITTANQCTAIGVGALNKALTNTLNDAFGYQALGASTAGTTNCAIGSGALFNLLTGNNNQAFGRSAGLNYTGAESSNLLLGNLGVLGESNVIRIGQQGAGDLQQNKAFIAGVTGITPAGSGILPVVIDSSGQLGTATSFASWTPTLIGSVVAGVTTYTTQFGRYTLNGNLVTAQFSVTISAATGNGTVVIGGLPLTINSTAGYLPVGICLLGRSGLTWPVGSTQATLIGAGGTTMAISCSGTGINETPLVLANTAIDVYGSIEYYI